MSEVLGKEIRGYRVLDEVGKGAFGAVYRAQQNVIGREVAIKIILPEFANRPDFIRSFEAEAQLVARLEHIHIVPLFDYWRDPDGAFLVMRLLPDSLRDGSSKLSVTDVFYTGLTPPPTPSGGEETNPTVAPIPEPGTVGLAGVAAVFLSGWFWRRRSQAQRLA